MTIELAITVFVTGILTTLVNYFLMKPKAKVEVAKTSAETKKLATDTHISDIGAVKAEADLLEYERKLIAAHHESALELETEKQSHKLDNYYNEREVTRLKEELNDLRDRFFKLAYTVDGLGELEKNCKLRLVEVESAVLTMQYDAEEANKKLKSYADRAAQLTALVQKANKSGFLSDADVENVKG